MRLRLWSSKHDGRFCSCCANNALYVMEMKTRHVMTVTRFCQTHIDEMRTMFGADPQQFYPKEDNPDTVKSDADSYNSFPDYDWIR